MNILKYFANVVILFIIFTTASLNFANGDFANILASLTTSETDSILKEGAFNEDNVMLINQEINHYFKLMEKMYKQRKMKKRSILNEHMDILEKDIQGVYVLDGFTQTSWIPVHSPKDILLFLHEYNGIQVWYAAALEESRSKKTHNIVIYRRHNNNFLEIARDIVDNARKMDLHTILDTTYIVVAQDSGIGYDDPFQGSSVFQFTFTEQLYKIQTLNISHTTDVAIWEDMNDIFLIFTQKMNNNSESVSYHVKSPIYKWLGKHFDIHNYVDTNYAQKALPFKIGDVQYLAIANYQNDKGETDIYSEIFKYDIHDEKFISHQKILTHAAVDIKHFCFKQNTVNENFIVVANSFKQDDDGNINYVTNSIIYKFVEEYFMPFQSITLNYIEEWVPLVGLDGEFILLASCKYEGVKFFQYDGWRFVERSVQYKKEAFSNGIIAMHPLVYDGKPTLVITNRNDHGNMMNIFTATFTYQNVMHDFQIDVNKWCEETMHSVLDNTYLKQLNKRVEDAPHTSDEILTFNGEIIFKNVVVSNLITDNANLSASAKLRTPEEEKQSEKIQGKLNKTSNQIKQLDEILQQNKTIVINGDVKIKNLHVTKSDRIEFDNLETKSINDVDMDTFFKEIVFLDDKVPIDENIEFHDVEIDNLTVEKFINNKPVEDLVSLSADADLDIDLEVNGTVFVDKLIVDGLVQNVRISNETVLLKDHNQTLKGLISFENFLANSIDVKYINSIEMKHLEHLNKYKKLYKNITSLTVENVTIQYFNGVDMKSLDRLALRTRGDQEIISHYEFETLVVDDFQVDSLLSGVKVPDDLISITTGTFFIPQDLIFTEDLETENLYVIERMNQIPVHNGKLDVLLKDFPKKQIITGFKTFENLNSLGPIHLQGRIKSKGLDRMKPLIIIDKPLTLVGNYTILGNTSVQKTLQFLDMMDESKRFSINRLKTKGLKLTATEIPVSLEFKEPVTINELYTDTINDKSEKSWIKHDDYGRDIRGRKYFENDVYVTGEMNISAINGVNLNDLLDNVLLTSGNQIITGNYRFNNIAVSSVISNKTYINDKNWEDVLTLDGDQHLRGKTIIKAKVSVSDMETESLELKGKILNYDFNKMLEDTAFINNEKNVTGAKTFLNDVSFENLHVKFINKMNVEQIRKQWDRWSSDIYIDRPFFPNISLDVNTLHCNNINGISSTDFGKVWLQDGEDQIISENQFFKNVYFQDGIEIETGEINEINLKELIQETVKIDEEHHFESAHFYSALTSEAPIIFHGKINDIDLNSFILSKGAPEQYFLSHKHIKSNFTVLGYLYVNGFISGVNLSNFEPLMYPDHQTSVADLIVNGSVNFGSHVSVQDINDYNIKEIAEHAWFTDEDTEITGYMIFDNVEFKKNVTVHGYVDGVNLEWLSKNYFSKTKNQTITAKLHFTNGVIFGSNVIAPEATVYGNVSNIDLKEFYENVMRHGDQVFNKEINFDIIEVTGKFDHKGLINNYNLSVDIMRSDIPKNVFTGKKIFRNVQCTYLEIPRAVKVQNVNINYWIENVMLTTGNYSVSGLKRFTNATFLENIEVNGLVNSLLFDENHILTTNTKQNIYGKKTFYINSDSDEPGLSINSLKVKQRINGINMTNFIENQLRKSKDVVIASEMAFYSPITANNVNFLQLYQNINVSSLVKNITSLHDFYTYEDEHNVLIEYNNLILRGLKNYAYFVDSYKIFQTIYENAKYVIPFGDSFACVYVLVDIIVVNFYLWNKEISKFERSNDDMRIERGTSITYTYPIVLNKKSYIYVENINDDDSYIGTMYRVAPNKQYDIYNIFLEETPSAESFTIPSLNQYCLVSMHISNKYANILCENQEKEFIINQKLSVPNGFKVKTSYIDDTPVIFILNAKAESTECINIWKFDKETQKFELLQNIYYPNPTSIDSVEFGGEVYVAVGIGAVKDLPNVGCVMVYRYDYTFNTYTEWHRIVVDSPVDVKFAILSSNELVLYIANDSPYKSLYAYLSDGIAGFKLLNEIFEVSSVNSLHTITDNDFLLTHNNNEVFIVKAMFKGKQFH